MIQLFYAKKHDKCCSCNTPRDDMDIMDFYKVSFFDRMENVENTSIILCKFCKNELIKKLGGSVKE